MGRSATAKKKVMQYSCTTISNHVGFNVSTSAWLKTALMGRDESSLGSQLPALEGTYCLHLYRSRVPKRIPDMSFYRSCMAIFSDQSTINPLKPELNSICYLLALLGAHHFLHVSRIRVKLTFRLLMSYIYGAPILDVSRSHTTTQHSR